MSHSNYRRTWQFAGVAVAIVVVALLGYFAKKHRTIAGDEIPAVASPEKKTASPATLLAGQSPATERSEPILQIDPTAVLASVNGRALKASDVLPPGASNQPVSMDVCEYFLQRAIDRELIFQAAKAHNIELDESQKQQMTDFQTKREQTGPNLVRNFNGGAAELSFESRDAEAFMLQTSLMAGSGASPNVSAEQVSTYYQQHFTDFGDLPATEPDRSEAWKSIDFQIREKLAPDTRAAYQSRLSAYMSQLKATANIQMTPLTSLASTP